MIANAEQNRFRPTRLIVAVATLLVLTVASPALASSLTTAQQTTHASQLFAKAGADKAGAKKEAAKKGNTTKKKAEKLPPELPSLPQVLMKLMPEKAHDIHHNWLHFFRPMYAFLIVFFALVFLSGIYRKRSILPSRAQMAMEMIVEGLDNLICGILGKKWGRVYFVYLASLFLYIVANNWFGQIPLMMSPTSFIAATGGLAICTFLVVQVTQFSKLGFKGVLHHWAGEPKDVVGYIVAVLLIPLHLVEEFVKPLSLALRLFGNIYGEDILLGSMLMLGVLILSFLPANGIPLGLPLQLPFMFLALLLSTIQALVFTLLSTIYILMILPHDDHEHEENAESHA